MNTFKKSNLKDVKNQRLFKMMYNFGVEYRPGNQMIVADWVSRLPCTKGAHEDFIIKNSEMGITVNKELQRVSLTFRDHTNTNFTK